MQRALLLALQGRFREAEALIQGILDNAIRIWMASAATQSSSSL
jgi:hypothetical protein